MKKGLAASKSESSIYYTKLPGQSIPYYQVGKYGISPQRMFCPDFNSCIKSSKNNLRPGRLFVKSANVYNSINLWQEIVFG